MISHQAFLAILTMDSDLTEQSPQGNNTITKGV